MSTFSVFVRDAALNRSGLISNVDLVDLALTRRRGDIGSWGLSLPLRSPAAQALRKPGSGIVCTQDGETIFSGPSTSVKISRTAGDPSPVVTVSGVDDMVFLSSRRAFPQPSNADVKTQSVVYDVRGASGTNVPVETAMLSVVNDNIGPLAPSGRRDDRIAMAASQGRGGNLPRISFRYETLLEALNLMGATTGLMPQVMQVGNKLQVSVVSIRDATRTARFNIYGGTTDSYELTYTAPKVTRMIMGGDGSGTSRSMELVSTTDSTNAEGDWAMVREGFSNSQGSTDSGELIANGQRALADDGKTVVSCHVEPVDNAKTQFRRNWDLGDLISVVIPDIVDPASGESLAGVQPIEQTQVTFTSGGFQATATVGDPDLTSGSNAAAILSGLREERRRRSNIERRK